MTVAGEGEGLESEWVAKGKQTTTEQSRCWHLRKALVVRTMRGSLIMSVPGSYVGMIGGCGAELASYDSTTGNLGVSLFQLEKNVLMVGDARPTASSLGVQDFEVWSEPR